MKRLVLLALAALSLAVAVPVSAKTVTMAVTKNGYVPKTVSLATGDSVTFVNQDTAAHQVALKPKTGFTCTAGLVLQPSQSTTCTFRVAATYQVTDPNNKGAAFKGTITVTGVSIAISLQAAPQLLTYGGKASLSGSLASGLSGEKGTVLAQQCGASTMRQLAALTSTSGGALSFVAQPEKNTTYEVRVKSATSSPVTVKVRPKLSVRKLARGKFSVKVLAAESFAGKAVVFQRFVKSTSRWVTIKTVLLKAGPTVTLPINPTTVSQATFRARVRVGLRVRAVMTQAQAGSCYAAGRSNVARA